MPRAEQFSRERPCQQSFGHDLELTQETHIAFEQHAQIGNVVL